MMKLAALTHRILPAIFGIVICVNANASKEIIFKNFETIPGRYSSTPTKISDGNKNFLDLGDTENPIALCVANGTATVVLDENGNGSLAVEDIDAGSTDNVGIAFMELSQTNFNCETTGNQPITLTVTDSIGNTATCNTNIEVVDVSPPLLSINDTIDLFLDASGSVALTPSMFNTEISDNCGIPTVSISPNVLNCSNINSGRPVTQGVLISEYVDGSGSNKYIELYNGSGAPADMSKYELGLLRDDEDFFSGESLGYLGILDPGEVVVLKNPNATLYTGPCYSSPFIDFDGNDILAMVKITNNSGDENDFIGSYGSAQDSAWVFNGISSKNHTLRRKISVFESNNDIINPEFLSEWDQFDMDDVSDLGLNSYQSEGTQVTIQAIDDSGNSSSTTIWVNVADTIAPILTSVPDSVESVATIDQSGKFHWTNPTATDNCEVTINVDSENHEYYMVGDTVVTVSAIDQSGNSTYTTFTATMHPMPMTLTLISDRDSTVCFEKPTIIHTLVSGGTRPMTLIWDGEVTDDWYYPISTPGTHYVEIIDAAGETISDSITLYQNPEIILNLTLINPSCDTCTDGMAYIDPLSGGTPPYQYGWIDSTLTTLALYQDTVYGLGYHQYYFIMADTVSCGYFQSFTFEQPDEIPPTAVCGNTTLLLDNEGSADLVPIDLDGGSSDNSGNLSFAATPMTFDCSNIGMNDVELTVSDAAGNSATCIGTVNVTDSLPPVVLIEDTLYVTIDNGGFYPLSSEDVDIGSYDNCGLSNFTVSPEYMTCADVVTGPPLANDLIISEYTEGSGNTKYIEIYNGTGTSVDMANYELKLYSNGALSPNSSAGLGDAGTLPNGETVVFQNASATAYSGMSYVNSTINFNGNDALALFNISTGENSDIFGVIGQNPGLAWETNGLSTKDHTLSRKRSVSNGNTNPANAGFLSEWEQKNIDDVTGLGSHSFALQGTEVTATVTDISGNTTTKSFIVVALDEVAPLFTSGFADVVVYSDPATCSAVANWPEPGVFDNCDYTLSGDHTSGETFQLGSTPVTYTAVDPSGNSSTLTFNVVVSPQPLIVGILPNQELSCHNTPAPITAFAFGGCMPYTYTWDGSAGNTETELIGSGTHELLVTDANGNTASTIFYLENPPALELNVTSTNPNCPDEDGSISVEVLGGTPPYTIDWNGGVSGSGYNLLNLGAGTYTATVTDSRGCSLIQSVILAGNDGAPPTAICASTTVYLDTNGIATITPSDIDGGSFDTCGNVSLSANQTVFSCNDTGENEIVLTVTDDSGNSANCTALVTVVDNQAPVLSDMPTDITATADPTNCSAIVTWEAPGATDNCSATISSNHNPGDLFGNGETLVTYTATDPSGNSVSESFTISVNPQQLSLNIEPQQDINCHGGTVDVMAYGIGGCAPYQYVWDGIPGTETHTAAAGNHTLSITDANGNTFSTTFELFEPEALELSLIPTNPSCDAAENGHIVATVNGGFPPYSNVWSGDGSGSGTTLTNIGTGTYISTVTDSAGCSTVQSLTLEATDTIPPAAVCTNTTLYLDENGEATLNPADINDGSFDICGNVSLFANQTIFSCSDTGENEIVLTVTDDSGNSASCTALVTVVDNQAPVLSGMPTDITATADPTNCSAIVTWGAPGATDNCSATISSDHNPGDLFGNGETLVTYTATDPSGNSVSESFTITVSPQELSLDIDPTQYIHCHGGTAELEAYGIGGCAPYEFSWDGVPGTETHTTAAGYHTISVTDANGNTFSAPFYLPEPEELVLNLSSTNPNCSPATDGQVTASVSGGVLPYSIVWSGDGFGNGTTLTNLGSGTYTATVTDGEGCSTVQSVTLTATDPAPPVAVCANTTLYLDQNGEATLNPADIDGGSYDNCGSVSIEASQTTFNCSDTGGSEVYLSVTDPAGNTTECAATVTVIDTIAPLISTQDIEVALDLTGFAVVTPDDIDNGTSDNCGIASIEITSGQVQYGCEDTGNTFAITLTATDIYGNVSNSVAQVHVVAGVADEDGDGISDSCDICFGDNSYGDADGDGICDAPQWCPGAYDILDPALPCDYQMTSTLNGFNANSGGIYCISGPYNGSLITVSNGSTVRLSGTGPVKIQIASNSAVEVEDGADVTFTSLYLGWNCRGLVIHSGATATVNNFSTTQPVVNCGTLNTNSFILGYNGIFTNYGILNVTGTASNNNINGYLVNRGEINISSRLTLSYTGNIANHCTINVAYEFKVDRFVNNHGFINVTGMTNIGYNGIVSLYDGAMFQTGSTRISGKYAGYGTSSLVKILNNTNATWTARILGELYYCDVNGIESAPNYNNLFQGNAIESCDLSIDITDCNPVGNVPSFSAMTSTGELTEPVLNFESTGDGLSAEEIALAVQEIESKDAILIFPNPTTGKALVEFTPKNTGDVTITIFNVRGKLLNSFTPAGQLVGQPFTANLDLSAYENGVYLIRITDTIRTVTRKLVVAR